MQLKSTRDDFVGRQLLEERQAHPQRRLVGLELRVESPPPAMAYYKPRRLFAI